MNRGNVPLFIETLTERETKWFSVEVEMSGSGEVGIYDSIIQHDSSRVRDWEMDR